MLNFPTNVTIYLHTAATDLRKGIDGLSGLVRGQFQEDPAGRAGRRRQVRRERGGRNHHGQNRALLRGCGSIGASRFP